ncbi:MAG: cytidine deaminase [Deltaproteobacteria bacterium]|nr:cytidine deaminase [Deltaproteobacteria bacterium]
MIYKKTQDYIRIAAKVREQAYAPYSKYKVGACIVTESGETFSGCNVENASYGGTVCAERVALYKAVSEGFRSFKTIIIVTQEKEKNQKGAPCGICRQVLYEFAPEIKIIVSDPKENVRTYSMKDILPHAFGPKNLNS